MNSSDSEDDCYGNIAQKLQRMKNNYKEDKVDCSNLLNDSAEIDEIVKKAGIPAQTVAESSKGPVQPSKEPAQIDEEPDETFINELIAGSSKRVTRSRKRGSVDSSASSSKSSTRRSKANESDNVPNEHVNEPPRGGRTPRGRGRNTRGQTRTRGRSRGRGGNRRGWFLPDPLIPIFSVGNTDEYPDECDNVELFSNAKKPQNDVVVLDETDPLDVNEELSVKVYWQSSEFFKFTIRKYQKLTQIFEYFSKKENVSYDKLFFTFNDRILTADDTPDSIDYNIVKFIDGGIVNQSVTKIVKEKQFDVKDGIRIKFQCQNIKKPFETVIQLDEKLSSAMVKCAEHFEKPLSKLKFQFDGDLISAKDTPRELELEGGECFDVKIVS